MAAARVWRLVFAELTGVGRHRLQVVDVRRPEALCTCSGAGWAWILLDVALWRDPDANGARCARLGHQPAAPLQGTCCLPPPPPSRSRRLSFCTCSVLGHACCPENREVQTPHSALVGSCSSIKNASVLPIPPFLAAVIQLPPGFRLDLAFCNIYVYRDKLEKG